MATAKLYAHLLTPMTFIIILVLVAAAAGFLIVRSSRRPRLGAGDSWAPAIEASARTLSGRRAISGGEAELRAELEGVTVTVKVKDDVAIAEAALYPGAKDLRLILSSGLTASSEDVSYIPEVPVPPAFGLDPPVLFRSDDAARAVQIAEESVLDLSRLQREAGGSSVELFVRGGSVKLTVRGARATSATIEALAPVAAHLVARVGGDRALAEVKLAQIPKAAPRVETCAFCGGERRAGVAWVKCEACASPHHAECWNSTHTCSKAGCGSARSTAI